jgi:hypothetical protein
MSYPSGRGMIFLYNLSRGSFWNLLGDYICWEYICWEYTSAVHLYLRSIFTAPPGFGFYCLVTLFITPLDYEL